MNNADKPIHPLRGADGRLFSTNGGYLEQAPVAMGLTKREHFAAMAMQGLLSNPNLVHYSGTDDKADRMRDMAVNYADGLLKALEEAE